jgi:hypothetical protein
MILLEHSLALALKFRKTSSHILPSKLSQLLSLSLKMQLKMPQLLITLLDQPSNQVWHLSTLLCINTSVCLKINQYSTGLESVSYSVTQVKTQLHENSSNDP